jgi:hypothetical protein
MLTRPVDSCFFSETQNTGSFCFVFKWLIYAPLLNTGGHRVLTRIQHGVS